ncbi:MAG: tRNA (adenosine(37)-N6)-threonylcarbamoyltransferase complex dimerization subunit type 1 TsaB [Clostridia bacterium]|nr:tRNA (adenosine(37)-N6)-threonylcarbamoyltransferase complex dimerization subunit type 1 TsaB [Clostridia bacterium]
MKACIIDSSANELALAVIDGDKIYEYVGNAGARRHTSEILVALDELFIKSGVSASELDYVGVVVGPGSFTGIRIGVSTANAMAYACGAKLVEITDLESMLALEDKALGLIDCKHDNYYCLYKDGENLDYKAQNVSEIEYAGKRILFTAPNLDNHVLTLKNKVAKGEFSTVAKPFYMKKSSAEM